MMDLLSQSLVWLLLLLSFALLGWVLLMRCRMRSYARNPHQSLAIIAELFPDNMLIVDKAGKIIASSQPAIDFFGYSRQELQGLSVDDLVPSRARSDHARQRREFQRGPPGKAMDHEVSCVNKAGEEIPALIRVRTFRVANKNYGIATIVDLRSFRDREEKLTELAERDPLTGLLNRRRFDEDCRREWQRARRTGKPLALIMVDVDSFKAYNDRHGHPAGDACLKKVAEILAAACRRPGDILARYGGEEFICLLPETDIAGAEAVAERMRGAVEAAQLPHGASSVSAWITLSIGVAVQRPTEGEQILDLLLSADRGLYLAKSKGRNRVYLQTASPEINRSAFDPALQGEQ